MTPGIETKDYFALPMRASEPRHLLQRTASSMEVTESGRIASTPAAATSASPVPGSPQEEMRQHQAFQQATGGRDASYVSLSARSVNPSVPARAAKPAAKSTKAGGVKSRLHDTKHSIGAKVKSAKAKVGAKLKKIDWKKVCEEAGNTLAECLQTTVDYEVSHALNV